jgi:hypothetical protein
VKLWEEKVAALKRGLCHNRMSLENNSMIVPLHCRQVIMLLTCWLKKANLFLMNSWKKCLQHTV